MLGTVVAALCLWGGQTPTSKPDVIWKQDSGRRPVYARDRSRKILSISAGPKVGDGMILPKEGPCINEIRYRWGLVRFTVCKKVTLRPMVVLADTRDRPFSVDGRPIR